MSSKKKMLVIDDDKIVLDSCARIFLEEGFDVAVSDNPIRGLEIAQEHPFDVILCDQKMPGIDGKEVIEILNSRHPETAILMITGYPGAESATKAMQRGALDYIPKPFRPDQILTAVARALAKKEKEREEHRKTADTIARAMSFPLPPTDDKPPKTIAETLSRSVGVGKATSPWISVLVLGVLAGAYIAFGAMLATTVTFDMAGVFGTGFTKFMSGAVFSLGLMLVIIAGAELFTGNNLMISSVMTGDIRFSKMVRRWGLVYIANFAGSIILALFFVGTGLWKTGDGALGAKAVAIAYGKVSLDFFPALLRAIGCNWLVCLAVWMALAARQTIGKIFAIFFPIMGFVALGFEHSVANMYFIPTGIFLKNWAGIGVPEGAAALNWGTFFLRNLFPVTLGNIIGGAVFVGMSYWSAYLRPAKSG